MHADSDLLSEAYEQFRRMGLAVENLKQQSPPVRAGSASRTSRGVVPAVNNPIAARDIAAKDARSTP
jgi:hypothetical protein